MTEDRADDVRKRLGQIGDELRSLESDDFAAKLRLNVEADGLRGELGALAGPGIAEIGSRWAARSARKASRGVDTDLQTALVAMWAAVSDEQGSG
jgi:hypothetical protein